MAVTNNLFKEEHKHTITLFFLCELESGEAKVMEPDKTEEWNWFEWKKLPIPLFIPITRLLEQGGNPFSAEGKNKTKQHSGVVHG
jgi:8-oxo-dGTP diphosphatase